MLSDPVAETATDEPETVALAVGDVIDVVGGAVSGAGVDGAVEPLAGSAILFLEITSSSYHVYAVG